MTKKKINIKGFLISLMFLLPGLTFLIGSWGAYWLDTNIQESGIQATALVRKKTFLNSADGDSDHILEYSFSTEDGKTIQSQYGVSKEFWNSTKEGDSLGIFYSKEQPTRNFPKGYGVTSLGLTIYVSVFGLIFTIFGGLLALGAFGWEPNNKMNGVEK